MSFVVFEIKYLSASSIDKAFMTKTKQFACEVCVCLLYVFLYSVVNSLIVFCADKNINWLGEKVIMGFLIGLCGTICMAGIILMVITFIEKVRDKLREQDSVCTIICASIMIACGILDIIWFQYFWGIYEITFRNCIMIIVASVIPAMYWSLIIYTLEFINNIKVYFFKDDHVKYEILYASDRRNVVVQFKENNQVGKNNSIYILMPKKELVNKKIYIERDVDLRENISNNQQIDSSEQ